MYCRNCGNEMTEHADVCLKCGVPKRKGSNFCHKCGKEVAPEAVVCVNCGVAFQPVPSVGKSRIMVGLLGIFLGTLGVHNFILGYTGKAVAQLLLTVLGGWIFGLGALASWIWSLVESIQILSRTVNEDAHGVPLVD